MFGYEVCLDSNRTGPLEFVAEQALAPFLVSILLVSDELLDPSKAFVADRTDRPHPVVHTMAAMAGVVSHCILSCSTGLSLEYVSMHSDHRKLGSTYLVREHVDLGPQMSP